MSPDEMMDLARALEKVPGLKGVEMRDVRRLARLLHDNPELGSIELKGFFGTGVVVTRTSHGAAPLPMAMSVAAPAQAAAQVAAPPSPIEASPVTTPVIPYKEIKSPMVGTFYSQAEPGSDPYVRIGSYVNHGETVCIIEAMKIMNEIEAEVSGVVREICVEDASPVEYGQVLYRVDPNG